MTYITCTGPCGRTLEATPDNFHRNKARPLGFLKRCKVCRLKEWQEYYASTAGKDAYYQANYGISLDGYESLLQEQDQGCAICGTADEKLAMDHNHSTNQVRGLLCRNCNTAIGSFKDDINLLWAAIEYLERYAKQQNNGS